MSAWTKEVPVEGYYWWRENSLSFAIIRSVRRGCVRDFDSTYKHRLEKVGGEWCGPINPPEDKP